MPVVSRTVGVGVVCAISDYGDGNIKATIANANDYLPLQLPVSVGWYVENVDLGETADITAVDLTGTVWFKLNKTFSGTTWTSAHYYRFLRSNTIATYNTVALAIAAMASGDVAEVYQKVKGYPDIPHTSSISNPAAQTYNVFGMRRKTSKYGQIKWDGAGGTLISASTATNAIIHVRNFDSTNTTVISISPYTYNVITLQDCYFRMVGYTGSYFMLGYVAGAGRINVYNSVIWYNPYSIGTAPQPIINTGATNSCAGTWSNVITNGDFSFKNEANSVRSNIWAATYTTCGGASCTRNHLASLDATAAGTNAHTNVLVPSCNFKDYGLGNLDTWKGGALDITAFDASALYTTDINGNPYNGVYPIGVNVPEALPEPAEADVKLNTQWTDVLGNTKEGDLPTGVVNIIGVAAK